MKLPTEVSDLAFIAIEKATQQLEKAALQDPTMWPALRNDRERQDTFLAHFAKTFNISLSLQLTGTTYPIFSRWKLTEIYFTQRYNEVHEHWRAKIMASAASRAVGYTTKCDPKDPTASGLMEDASGSPIYQGADTRLSLRFLETMYPEFSPKLDIHTTDNPLRHITEDDDAATAADAYASIVASQ